MNGVGLKNEEAFSQLLDNDQLTTSLVTSSTFPGFQELSVPSFAPTYKKKVMNAAEIIMYRREIWVIQRTMQISIQ